MHSRGRDAKHFIALSLFKLWWTFWRIKDCNEGVQYGFYWPTLFKDAYLFVVQCDRCRRSGNISMRHEMFLHKIL